MKNKKWVTNSNTDKHLKPNTKYYVFIKTCNDGSIESLTDTDKNGANFLRDRVGKSLSDLGYVKV